MTSEGLYSSYGIDYLLGRTIESVDKLRRDEPWWRRFTG